MNDYQSPQVGNKTISETITNFVPSSKKVVRDGQDDVAHLQLVENCI